LNVFSFFNNIHAGPDSDTLYTQLTPFYEMMEKGIISVPAKGPSSSSRLPTPIHPTG